MAWIMDAVNAVALYVVGGDSYPYAVASAAMGGLASVFSVYIWLSLIKMRHRIDDMCQASVEGCWCCRPNQENETELGVDLEAIRNEQLSQQQTEEDMTQEASESGPSQAQKQRGESARKSGQRSTVEYRFPQLLPTDEDTEEVELDFLRNLSEGMGNVPSGRKGKDPE